MSLENPNFQEEPIEKKEEVFLDSEKLFELFSETEGVEESLDNDQLSKMKEAIEVLVGSVKKFKDDNPEEFEKITRRYDHNESIEESLKKELSSDKDVEKKHKAIYDAVLSPSLRDYRKAVFLQDILEIEMMDCNKELKDVIIDAAFKGVNINKEWDRAYQIKEEDNLDKLKLVIDAFEGSGYVNMEDVLDSLNENKNGVDSIQLESVEDFKKRLDFVTDLKKRGLASGIDFNFGPNHIIYKNDILHKIDDNLDLIVKLKEQFSLEEGFTVEGMKYFFDQPEKNLESLNDPEAVGNLKRITEEFHIRVKETYSIPKLFKVKIENGEGIKSILESLKIDEILIDDFLRTTNQSESIVGYLEKIKGEGREDKEPDQMLYLVRNSSDFKYFDSEFKRVLSRTRGNYALDNFPEEITNYVCYNQTMNCYLLRGKTDFSSRGFGEEMDENSSLLLGKIYNKFKDGTITREDLAYTRTQVKDMTDKENMSYLLLADKFGMSFDYFGVNGNDLEEIKSNIDSRARELINDYDNNKERYWPHIESILGYAKNNGVQVNQILGIDNLWNFKFDHIADLKVLVDRIKDEKFHTGGVKVDKMFGTHIENMEEHLRLEDLDNVEDRLSSIKEKNKDKASKLIDELRQLILKINNKEDLAEKDFNRLLSNRKMFEILGLTMTIDSIKDYQDALFNNNTAIDIIESVEILKEPEEYLSAMNMNPSCMRIGGTYESKALNIAQGPVLIIGAKDAKGRIVGRCLLIPLKTEEGWMFEAKRVYGNGENQIADFIEKLKSIHGLGIAGKIDGVLGKSKRVKSAEKLDFYRDDHGLVSFEALN